MNNETVIQEIQSASLSFGECVMEGLQESFNAGEITLQTMEEIYGTLSQFQRSVQKMCDLVTIHKIFLGPS